MLTDLDLTKIDGYTEAELQVLANSINAFLVLDELRSGGAISVGPTINKEEMQNLLVYCRDRSVSPDTDPKVVEQYIIAVAETF